VGGDLYLKLRSNGFFVSGICMLGSKSPAFQMAEPVGARMTLNICTCNQLADSKANRGNRRNNLIHH